MKKTYNSFKALLLIMGLNASNMSAQYCLAQATSTGDEEIFNVTLGTLNNTSNCFQTGGPGSFMNMYSDYTNSTPAVAAPICIVGFNYPLSVTVGQCLTGTYSGYVRVWIDYNNNTLFTDPGENVFTSVSTIFNIPGTIVPVPGGITIPPAATIGNTRMRVAAQEGGIPNPCGNFTWGEVEDYSVFIGSNVPCSGTPGPNSVVTPTGAICPNSATSLGLLNTYTVGGMQYQWLTSTLTAFGPWTPVVGGTLTSLTTPSLNVPTFYSVIITCSVSNATITATSGTVMVQPTTTNTIPYCEGFEGIGGTNKLPNCSWQASNLPTTCQTYTAPGANSRFACNGNNFASFYYLPAGNNYFFSNGLLLEAGVTYSASLNYLTDYSGALTWNLRMYIGPNQSTVGGTVIASNLPAVSSACKVLSNTFTVGTTGIYYVGINGQSNGNCCAYYLSWDDLCITVPCQLNPNTPTVAISVPQTTICSGSSVNLTATGATSYLWSNGATTNAILVSPNNTMLYSVVGLNAASNCTASVTQLINVNPSPQVNAFSNLNPICAGKTAVLTAFGASTYSWSSSPPQNGAVINVTPNSTITYSVNATSVNGCVGSAAVTLSVNPNPTVTASSNKPFSCAGTDAVVLTGSGASTYTWVSSSSFHVGSPITVSPLVSTTYTVTGMNPTGCYSTYNIQQEVDACTGLNNVTITNSGIQVYPNPNNGEFVVELKNASNKAIEVTDITGRVIVSVNSNDFKTTLSLNEYASGVYYVKIQTESAVDVIKVVKQ